MRHMGEKTQNHSQGTDQSKRRPAKQRGENTRTNESK